MFPGHVFFFVNQADTRGTISYKDVTALFISKVHDRSIKTWTKNMHSFYSVRLIQVFNNRNDHKIKFKVSVFA